MFECSEMKEWLDGSVRLCELHNAFCVDVFLFDFSEELFELLGLSRGECCLID